MSCEISFKDNSLTIDKVSKIFPDRVKNALETPFGILVLFDGSTLVKRNLFLLNRDFTVIWQVEDINPKMANTPYTYVRYENNKIIAVNWIGFTCEINPITGGYENAQFTK